MRCFCVECGDEVSMMELMEETGLAQLLVHTYIHPFVGRAIEIFDADEDCYWPNILQFDEETFICPSCSPGPLATYKALISSMSDRSHLPMYPRDTYLARGFTTVNVDPPRPLPEREGGEADPNCNCNRCSGERP